MNNEPVACDCSRVLHECSEKEGCRMLAQLNTHPAKTQSHTETAVKILNYLGYAQEPSKEEGADVRRDKLVEIISQSHSAKTLTELSGVEIIGMSGKYDFNYEVDIIDFARAILRKAQE